MNSRDLRDWMWAEAVDLLDRAERMHRQFFQPTQRAIGAGPAWEPPVDVFETDRELIILVALPGVLPENIQVNFDGSVLSVLGDRTLACGGAAAIRRLEIPHGRFERHIELAGLRLNMVRQELANGCLVLVFAKSNAGETAHE
jgi:HSP20 family molecular chaperone IbpA